MSFKPGDRVIWESQSAGSWKRKIGNVMEVHKDNLVVEVDTIVDFDPEQKIEIGERKVLRTTKKYSPKINGCRLYSHEKNEMAVVEENPKEDVHEVESSGDKMEFRIIRPTQNGFLKAIEWNRKELEEAVKEKVSAYQNVVYSEENLKQAKEDRAELNKLAEAIEDRRKRVKNIIMEPYITFESEVKEVLELIKEPVSLIDKQIKGFEEQQREVKKNNIRESYEEVIGDLAGVLPFERVFDSRYLNKTYKLSDAQTEVREKVEKARTDLETIDGLDSKFKLNAKDVYIKTLDISKALAENKRLSDLEEKLEAEKRRKAEEEAERKRLAEERRKQEEERRAKEERLRLEEARLEAEQAKNQNTSEEIKDGTEQPDTGTNGRERGTNQQENESEPISPMGNTIDSIERQAFAAVVDPFEQKPAEEKRFRTRFCAVGTRAQLEGLIQYMRENGIEYGRIK